LPDSRAVNLRENYPRVASDILRPLLNVFSAARDICDGDVDKFLILMVLGMRITEHPEFKQLTHSQIMAGEPRILPSLGTNTRSIAASVGIPKETARRKLAELVDSGWLVRQHWDFRLTAEGYAALDPIRTRVQAMALHHHNLIAELFPR
jgi:hypothetical protein